jgi:hypothetical protein
MRAAERCKEHSEGDHCRKALGHEGTDPVHEGQFTAWQSNKFREQKFRLKAPARNRGLNRFVRTLGANAHRVPMKERAGFLSFLNRAIKNLRGAA